MKIILNHNPEEFDAETLTIRDILRIRKFSFPALVIKINGKLVRKHEYDEATVVDGDNVEIIHLISGG